MSILEKLAELVPPDQISTHPDQLAVVSKDESGLTPVIPIAVLWPDSGDQIAKIVKECHESKTPITTRGAGSALEGSTIPLPDGIVLDLSRMTAVSEFWPQDLQVRVEPGIIYDNLNEQLKREGLFFPPSPGGSGDIATIGGMISTNASGIYSVKYGGTRNYVIELEIVTGDGKQMRIGNRAIKRSSGYNLVDLISGSEGTLAVITSATLRLAGLPEDRLQAAFQFNDVVKAARAVSEMCRYGVDAAAIELLDTSVMQALNRLKNYGLKEVPCLFLEFHGPKAAIKSSLEMTESICAEHGGTALQLAEGQRPWEIRHFVTEAIKHRQPGFSIIRNDVAFPISRLPEMIEFCHRLGDESNLMIHTFGHVGMGLLHSLILADRQDADQWKLAREINDRIISRTLELGGTVSGEHGIGLAHKDHFQIEHGEAVELMRCIKKQFDPHNILNPDKIFNVHT